jgi:hypothetical protein
MKVFKLESFQVHPSADQRSGMAEETSTARDFKQH